MGWTDKRGVMKSRFVLLTLSCVLFCACDVEFARKGNEFRGHHREGEDVWDVIDILVYLPSVFIKAQRILR